MAYSPPVITAAGLTVPSFSDIQQSIISSYQSIYGSTTYLGNDSADYQWISIVALKLSDNCGLCQLTYNARSPVTAIGADLDAVVKLNGIARLSAEPSTALLTLTGTSGTSVVNAVISDVNGILWNLPASVVIGSSGSVNVLATCQEAGPIQAAPNTIVTPVGGFTAGWKTVTNPGAATLGTPIEADSALRARQSISVAGPSSTRLAGTIAALKQVPGVTNINVIENQYNAPDVYGNTGHSITCVVQGGDPLDIATAIYKNKGIGCNTQAVTDANALPMTIVPVTDPVSGTITNIGFLVPKYWNGSIWQEGPQPIYVTLDIHPLTTAYNTAMQTDIIAAIAGGYNSKGVLEVGYLNELQIGEEVTQSALYGVALSVMSDLTKPDFSIKAIYLDQVASPTSENDLTLNFYQVASGIPANIVINTV